MTKRTLASLGACALSSLLLGGCPSDPGGGPMDSVDLAQVDAAGPEDMATSLPDLIGAAAPTKVTGFMQKRLFSGLVTLGAGAVLCLAAYWIWVP